MFPQPDDPRRPRVRSVSSDDDSLSDVPGGEPLPPYAPDRRTPFVPLRTATPAPVRRVEERRVHTPDWRAWGAAAVGAALALVAFAAILAWAVALRG